MGNTLQKKIVRKATVDQYLGQAVKFVESHTKPDPTINLETAKRHDFIEAALTQLKCWEKVPNRCQPVTIAIIIVYVSGTHAGSLEHAIID